MTTTPRECYRTRAGRAATLLRWLGPWSDAVPRARASLASEPLRHVRLALAERGTPTLLILPGLHFLGPDDPRFRRFGAVLAQTGAEVVAPHLGDLLALHLTPRLLDEAGAALVLASERAQGPVAVMSISFGSIAALHLAAIHPERVRRLVLFGGYRSYQRAFCFALGGAIAGFPAEVRDPLNGPAVLANLADELLPEPERAPFRAAALAFSRATWSRAGSREDKRDGRHLRVGRELAETLPAEARALFRIACRLDGDPLALAQDGMLRARERIAFLDPGPLLSRIQVPVTCVHGLDDDVIPWTESVDLAADLPRGRAIVTGLYGHTGRRTGGLGVAALARELRAMSAVIQALVELTEP